MEDKNKPGLAARALAAVKRFAGGERPETLKGLKGVWLMASCAGVVCVLLTLVMGLCGEAGWAGIFAGCAVALLLFIAFYPLESGMPVSRAYASLLRWFNWVNF